MSNTPSTPNIDWNTSQNNAQQVYNTVYSLLTQWNVPGYIASVVAGILGGLIFVVSLGVITILQAVVAVASWFAELFMTSLDAVKSDNRDQLNDLLAVTVNELLGTAIDGAQLAGGSGSGSTWDANLNIGTSLIGLFEQAFGATGPVSPTQGQSNAYKFAGFSVNFATTQGFFSILAEAASIGFLKEFHELPDGLMQSLGLGRLQRLALQPLIRNAIQQPYDLYCRSVFRPDRLAEAQAVKAYHEGNLAEGDCRQLLAEKGYPDGTIDYLMMDVVARLSVGDLLTLRNNSDISDQDVINNLTLDGMDENSAALQVKAANESSAKGEQSAYLAELTTAYVNGFIDEPTWNSLLGKLPLSDEEDQAYRDKVGFMLDTPVKVVSLGDVQTAIVAGITDFAYLDQWLKTQRYDEQSQLIITYLTIEKMNVAAAKEAAIAYKRKLLQAANKPVPPWLEG